VALLGLTRLGVPVSTSFLVLTAMAPVQIEPMLRKSLTGYGVAFGMAALVYGVLAPWLAGALRGAEAWTLAGSPPGGQGGAGQEGTAAPDGQAATGGGQDAGRAFPWLALRWLATVALWSQWLVQDLANIYVYLPRHLNLAELLVTLMVLCGAVALLVSLDGGPMQGRLRGKCHIDNPRAWSWCCFSGGIACR
jgi:hypothetical protein